MMILITMLHYIYYSKTTPFSIIFKIKNYIKRNYSKCNLDVYIFIMQKNKEKE